MFSRGVGPGLGALFGVAIFSASGCGLAVAEDREIQTAAGFSVLRKDSSRSFIVHGSLV